MSMLQLEVVTPDKTVVSAQVDMAVCPGVMGEFGVLPHHVSPALCPQDWQSALY